MPIFFLKRLCAFPSLARPRKIAASRFRWKVDPMAPRPFNIRLWFALCALGAITLICAVAGFWMNF